MTDAFSKPVETVQYFGVWAADAVDCRLRDKALTVLRSAVEQCMDRDMRADAELAAALAWLTRTGHEKRARAFRKALDMPAPAERRQTAAVLLRALQKAMERAWGGTDKPI